LFYLKRTSANIYRRADPSGTIHVSDDPADAAPQKPENLRIAEEHQLAETNAEVHVEKSSLELILVDAVLNGGVKAKMVFDTGADIVEITEDLSRKLRQVFPREVNRSNFIQTMEK
jgi:hypothetical protein